MRRCGYVLCYLLLVVFFVACSSAPATPESVISQPDTASVDDNTSTLTLADISDDPAEAADQMQPIADYLASHLGEYGITRGEVRVTSNADDLAELIKSGEVDLYFDSLYPATLLSEASGAKAVLRRWRRGVGEYHTVIYTAQDSGIESLADLPGHMVAMDNPFSTSGYVLPAVYVLDQGFTLTPKQTYDEAVAADEIGFVFSYDDQNALQWLVNGLVDAAVTDDNHYRDFPQDVTDNMVILAETKSVPRQVVLVQPNLDPDLETAIIQLLLSMDQEEEGRAALESFDLTAKFDEFPGGITAAQDEMRQMIEQVRTIELPDWVFKNE